MKKRDLIKRSLLFHKKAHIRTILGCALSTAILTGALMIGDSVRLSLREMVIDRLGETAYALEAPERFFTTQLAERLSKEIETEIAPVLRTQGIVSIDGGKRRANRVQVLGVDRHFNAISNSSSFYTGIRNNEVIINSSLAKTFDLKTGDEILLHLHDLDYIPRDVPLATIENLSITGRYIIKDIATVDNLGNFNLRISQVVPGTVFMSLDHLGEKMELSERANILLVTDKNTDPITSDILQKALSGEWRLEDAGLTLNPLSGGQYFELRSDRVFIDPVIERAASKTVIKKELISTYFVNDFTGVNGSTPYSFISAPGPETVPSAMKDGEILVNTWLANDLGLEKGDPVEINYFIPGKDRTLVEKSESFRVHDIVPLHGIYADKALMPEFPGLSDKASCRDWDPGIPIDLDKIRDKDEQYWEAYRGIPKAFITLDRARALWSNRFGALTAIRFHNTPPDSIRRQLLSSLDPSSLGLFFIPVREQGFKAGTESVDFAQLFIGLSFFIIVGALLLTALLFSFMLDQRMSENGLLLALGYKESDVYKLFLTEGAILAISGGLIGMVLAVFYNIFVLTALKTVWHDIVGTGYIQMHVETSTLLTGFVVSVFISFITIWLVTRKHIKISITKLQRGSGRLQSLIRSKYNILYLSLGIILLVFALYMVLSTDPGRSKDAAATFFIAGLSLLISGMLFINFFFNRQLAGLSSRISGLVSLGFRNTVRNKPRSIALAGLLASGLFIVFTVGSNQQGMQKDIHLRSSGTGGFALFGESLIPVLHDLNTEEGREFYGIGISLTDTVSVVHFRVREGDDASCLNLNRISTPRLIGVDPAELSSRQAFSFVSHAEKTTHADAWQALHHSLGEDIVPGIADETVIIWGLGKSVGDTLLYFDENGQPFRIKLIAGLANSVFQGNLIISEKHFRHYYPSISGYRLFLIDTPPKRTSDISQTLTWALQDLGFEAVSTTERLAAFNKVQNTYLSIFLILGGLGLVLGTVGIAIIVLRNVNERRNELALLQSVGFSRRSLQFLILYEHGFLIFIGIILGLFASLTAALPAILTPDTPVPYLVIILTLLAVSINAGLWTYLATRSATSGDLIPALRNE